MSSSSSSTFPYAGDLFNVRVSAVVNSSAPCTCNTQFNISTDCRKISSGTSLDCDGRVSSSLKWKTSCHNHRLFSRRGRRFLPPSTALKRTVEESAVGASDSSDNVIQNELSVLDAYFTKLQGKSQLTEDTSRLSEARSKDDTSKSIAAPLESSISTNALSQDGNAIKNDLQNVELYLERLAKGLKEPSSPAEIQKSQLELWSLIKEIAPSLQANSVQKEMDNESDLEMDDVSSSASTESSVVYILAAINIAIYLFGLASPIDTAGMGTSTLPLLYGAKVNALLLNGEWWRLVTPMFLHSGFFHVALSTWALLFFGPQVENVFGPLAFCMIYFLGGLCGNMFSFFFTPDATVGGTGPLFALFSAWVVYLWQNKAVLGEKFADYGIKATTLMGVLVLVVSCLLPTDEWIHVGAILPGVLFGAFASPLLQIVGDGGGGNESSVKNAESKQGDIALFDGPSVLSLTVGFAISMTLCFALYYFLTPIVAESQLLNSTPF